MANRTNNLGQNLGFSFPNKGIMFPLTNVDGFLGTSLRKTLLDSINPLIAPIRIKKHKKHKICKKNTDSTLKLQNSFLNSISSLWGGENAKSRD